MASSKEYLDFILEQLSGLDDVTYRAMMGEYIIYYRGKIVGGIYDDCLFVKPTKSAVAMMPNTDMELPYDGAKEMLLVDNVDNKEFLRELLVAMYPELPAPKKNNKIESLGDDSLNESELYKELGVLTKEKDKWEESIQYVSSLLSHDSVKIKAKAL